MLYVGSIFSGIGGIELGLERTGGFKVAWMGEIDQKARKVLSARFPGIPLFGDVRELGMTVNAPRVDVLSGGFPCQDLSFAGRREGLNGERSGLWREFYRLIRHLQPRYVIVENVAAILTPHRGRGEPAALGRVLGDLSESGYDAEWQIISAESVGAPHRRERVFIVAYPRYSTEVSQRQGREMCAAGYSSGVTQSGGWQEGNSEPGGQDLLQGIDDVAHPCTGCVFGDLSGGELKTFRERNTKSAGQWAVEPPVGRVVDGFPGRMDEIKQLGNAVVPQVAEIVGHLILEREQRIHGLSEVA